MVYNFNHSNQTNMQTMSFFTTLLFSLFSIASCQKDTMIYTNQIDDEKMLLVITPPSINNNYYKNAYDDIVAFDIAYAKSIMGKDNIIVLGDAATLNYLKQYLVTIRFLPESWYDMND